MPGTPLASAIDSIIESGIPAAGKRFGSALNVEWIDEAIEQTGTASVRRRRLPAPRQDEPQVENLGRPWVR